MHTIGSMSQYNPAAYTLASTRLLKPELLLPILSSILFYSFPY
jgi:hypothetical protein